MKLSPANMAILKNMCDLMTRELWGAYEDSYKQRILQLKKVGCPACQCLTPGLAAGSNVPALRCACSALAVPGTSVCSPTHLLKHARAYTRVGRC